MQVGIVIRGESVGIGEAVEIGHRGTADNVGVAGVFLKNNKNVAELKWFARGSEEAGRHSQPRPRNLPKKRRD